MKLRKIKENPLVSIAVAAYNVEEYIKECIESAMNQTYKNLEIILVDDGSKDCSGKICDEYALMDKRIKVIHKENGGLSDARNVAIDLMRGEYVLFLDGDDYICLDLVETYVEWIKKYDADIVVGTYYTFWGEATGWDDKIKTQNKEIVLSKEETLRRMLMDEELHHGASGPLFKSGLYKDIRFPVDTLYEDFATTYYVVGKCKRIVYCDDKRQFYRMRPGSIMNSKITEKNIVLLDIADEVLDYFAENYPELIVPAIRRQTISYMNLYYEILKMGFGSFREQQSRIKKKLLDNRNIFLNSDCIKKSEKIKLRLFINGKYVFYFFCKIRELIRRYNQRKA